MTSTNTYQVVRILKTELESVRIGEPLYWEDLQRFLVTFNSSSLEVAGYFVDQSAMTGIFGRCALSGRDVLHKGIFIQTQGVARWT